MKNDYYIENGISYVTLTQGQVCTVDEADLPIIAPYSWCAHRQGKKFYPHARIRGGKGHITMHRLLMGLPEEGVVDHIDGNPLNNCRSNLRIVTQQQNLINQSRRANNTSGFKGVSYCGRTKKWRAAIRLGGKTKQLGRYTFKHEAALRYNEAAIEHWGPLATGRVLNHVTGSEGPPAN